MPTFTKPVMPDKGQMVIEEQLKKANGQARIQIPTDKDKTVIECSNCGKGLVSIYPAAKAEIETTFVAQCCFCGDKSYECTIRGLLKWAPEDYVSVEDIEPNYKTGIMVFKTKKVDRKYD